MKRVWLLLLALVLVCAPALAQPEDFLAEIGLDASAYAEVKLQLFALPPIAEGAYWTTAKCLHLKNELGGTVLAAIDPETGACDYDAGSLLLEISYAYADVDGASTPSEVRVRVLRCDDEEQIASIRCSYRILQSEVCCEIADVQQGAEAAGDVVSLTEDPDAAFGILSFSVEYADIILPCRRINVQPE